MHEKTLKEAQAEVYAGRIKGITCPCCGGYARRYKTKLHSQMAQFLIGLYKAWLKNGMTFVHTRTFMEAGQKASTDGVKLIHWNLIETMPTDDETQRASGMYRPTALGVQFVQGKVSVAAHVFTYKNKCEGFSTEMVTIQQALGKKFNYAELMKPNSEEVVPAQG